MAWLYLFLGGLCEIIWVYGLKMANNFTDLWWSSITITCMIVSFSLFAQAMKTIPIGTAYALFTGIGAGGTAIVGILLLHEEVNVWKILSLLLLIGGIIGLKIASKNATISAKEKPC